MRSVLGVFFRGLLGVCAVTAVVAIVWTTYLQRDALSSALSPAAGLVDRLRGVSEAPDRAPAVAPGVVAPAVVEAPAESKPGPSPEGSSTGSDGGARQAPASD